MVDAIPPDELARWQALAIHDGWGEDEHRTAGIRETIHNGFLVLASKMGHEVKPSEIKSRRKFMPPECRPAMPKKAKQPQSDEQPQTPAQTSTDAWMRRMAGFR